MALEISAQLTRFVIRLGAIDEKCREASGKLGDRRSRAERTLHASAKMTGLSDRFNCWAAVVVQLLEFALKNSSELCCARRAMQRRPVSLERGSDTHALAADCNPRRAFSSAERMLPSASRDLRKRIPKSESVPGLRTWYDAARDSIWKAR